MPYALVILGDDEPTSSARSDVLKATRFRSMIEVQFPGKDSRPRYLVGLRSPELAQCEFPLDAPAILGRRTVRRNHRLFTNHRAPLGTSRPTPRGPCREFRREFHQGRQER